MIQMAEKTIGYKYDAGLIARQAEAETAMLKELEEIGRAHV